MNYLTETPKSPLIYLKLILILITTVVLGYLVLMHVEGLNGPSYHKWKWQRIAAWRYYPAMLAAAIPFFIGQYLYARGRRPARVLPLLMASMFALQVVSRGMQAEPFSLEPISRVVKSPIFTSYFTDAVVLIELNETIPIRQWMEIFPDMLPMLHLHAKFKPPGLILYYVLLIKILGPDAAAMVGGLLIGMLATLSVPATYRLIKFGNGNEAAAFHGASFLALCPSLILFFPMFDQVYPVIGCLLMGLWMVSLLQGKQRHAVGFGLTMALGLFLSYILLLLGVFLAGFTILYMGRFKVYGIRRVVVQGIIVLLTIVLSYAVLLALIGFNPISTFRAAAALQEQDLVILARPFPLHMIHDVFYFAMGSGWISYLLVFFSLIRIGDYIPKHDASFGFAFLALLQIIIVALAALLPGESARLWMLLLPLLMVPVGLELRHWSFVPRMGVYLALWFTTAVIGQNLIWNN